MRNQQYVVKLNVKERSRLEDLSRKGKSSTRGQLRARILLHADTGHQGSAWNDVQIAGALGTYPVMCARDLYWRRDNVRLRTPLQSCVV
jgi:hypothetical protein